VLPVHFAQALGGVFRQAYTCYLLVPTSPPTPHKGEIAGVGFFLGKSMNDNLDDVGFSQDTVDAMVRDLCGLMERSTAERISRQWNRYGKAKQLFLDQAHDKGLSQAEIDQGLDELVKKFGI
jgi:hypothetical protein